MKVYFFQKPKNPKIIIQIVRFESGDFVYLTFGGNSEKSGKSEGKFKIFDLTIKSLVEDGFQLISAVNLDSEFVGVSPLTLLPVESCTVEKPCLKCEESARVTCEEMPYTALG